MTTHRDYKAASSEWASNIANLRPWRYLVTLTYRDGLTGSESITSKQLKDWAKHVQKRYSGRFEYVAFPEHMDHGRFDHLHLLLYISTLEPVQDSADGLRRVSIGAAIKSAWRFGFSDVKTISKGSKNRTGAASYVVKDFGANTPIFMSDSLARPLPDLTPRVRRSIADQMAAHNGARTA